MSDILQVGTLSAKAGEKVQGFFSVEGTPVKMPVTLINGMSEGKTVLITGGTHGGEYPGVETSIRLAAQLQPEEVSGQVIVIHPVNVPAFFARLQYVGPYDGLNLNREYPGKATGSVTQRIAYAISSQLFTQADLYLDLHGGDLHEDLEPFVIYSVLGSDEVNEFSQGAAKATGIKYVCKSVSDNGTFGSAAKMGVPGFLAEIGGSGLWCEAEVVRYVDAIKNVLRFAGVLPGEAQEYPDAVVSDGMAGLEAGFTGCWYPCVKKNEMVKKGDKVGEIRDFFGKVLEEYTAPESGVTLFVVSSLAIEKGDPIYALAKV